MTKPEMIEEEFTELAYNIGALFLNFGGFEHTLNLALAAALELTPLQERTLLRGMMARAKVELLNSFSKRHFSEAAHENVKKLTGPSLELIDYRNDIAHGFSALGDDGKMHLITFRGKDRFYGKAEPISVTQLERYIQGAEDLGVQFQRLADALIAERETRVQNSPPPS